MLEKPIESLVLIREQSKELVNQQGNYVDWLSGFVDGEGTFTFNISYQRKNVSPRFQVCNTSLVAFEKCREILDLNGVKYFVSTQKLNKNWKTVWKIQVVRFKQLLNLLNLLIPSLVVKKHQAECLKRFIEERIGNPIKGYTKSQLELVEIVRRANQRGPSETFKLPSDFYSDNDKVQSNGKPLE